MTDPQWTIATLRVLLLATLALAATTTAAAQVVVIAHPSVPVDSLDRDDLLDFYTGDVQYWANDAPITVFDLKPRGTVKDAFYSFLGKSSSRMKSIWLKRKLSGEGDPPAALDTEDDVLARVAATPGAIGFVSKAKVSERVKVVVEIHPD